MPPPDAIDSSETSIVNILIFLEPGHVNRHLAHPILGNISVPRGAGVSPERILSGRSSDIRSQRFNPARHYPDSDLGGAPPKVFIPDYR